MFKIIVLKSQYNLSDEMTEFFIRDRKTFQDFLGITPYHTIPDAKTIWLFAEQMKNASLDEMLFDKFLEMLESKGIKPQGGTLVDGTFVEVPRQHNTKEENEQIKNGEIPKSFEANKHKLAQKDCDASWTKKNEENYFGYKDHPWVDVLWKLMCGYAVTTAKVHDSVPYLYVIPEKPRPGCEGAYSDSAYIGKEIEQELLQRGYDPQIIQRGFRKIKPKPLSGTARRRNKDMRRRKTTSEIAMSTARVFR
jgi:IS5 family transposase